MTCGSFGALGFACPSTTEKRFVTSRKTVAEYIGPEPKCDHYAKCMVDYNCPPTPEFEWLRNGEPIPEPTENEIMALNPIASPSTKPDCEKYVSRFAAVDSTSGVTDVASLAQFILDNEAGDGEYENFGAVDLAADTVLSITLMPRPEDGEDMLLVDGFEQGGFMFDAATQGPFSDVSGITLSIPDPCNFLASICLERCLTKAEIAAL